MGVAGPPVAIKREPHAASVSRTFDLQSIPPRLVVREPPETAHAPLRRTRIWEFNTNLHCSIIGTCLSTGELRQVLKKLGVAPNACSDHELHGIAVTLAGRHDTAGKLLNKALDQRHKLAVSQFGKAASEAELRTLWTESVRRGEIPGAYWATLTHPQTTQAIIREAFGEVHMLSHLVGSANRADIRRLCQLEAEKMELEEKLDRQQEALHQAVVTRDRQIEGLRQALAQRIAAEPAASQPDDRDVLNGLVVDLEGRLGLETRRRSALDERLAAAEANLVRERSARIAAERAQEAMRRELDAVESSLTAGHSGTPEIRLDGVTLLYVGGRPNQIAQMREAVERFGAVFLHHDGGIENHQTLLPGLASRANLVLFPVDCISHDAVGVVKTICRQSGKRYLPLRSASVTSLLAAVADLPRSAAAHSPSIQQKDIQLEISV